MGLGAVFILRNVQGDVWPVGLTLLRSVAWGEERRGKVLSAGIMCLLDGRVFAQALLSVVGGKVEVKL